MKKIIYLSLLVIFIFSMANYSFAAVDAGNKICPVMGGKTNEKYKATYEYEGKIYNFCCAGCIEEFKKHPQEYIKKVDEEMKK